jgi:phage terminase large subunit
MYLYREIYMTKCTVRVHAKKINELSQGERIEQTICDHDAEDRATLLENGITSIAADKRIKVGIDKVSERLDLREDKKPGIFFFKNALVEMDTSIERGKAKCTYQEFPGYVWPRTSDGRPVKEVPVKVDDHGMDTTRYAVMYVDGGLPSAGDLVDFV